MKKSEADACKDPEYYKAMLKLYALEKHGRTCDEEASQREQLFMQRIRTLEEEKRAENGDKFKQLSEEKTEFKKRMEEEKSEYNQKIEAMLKKYNEAIARSVLCKKELFTALMIRKGIVEKQESLNKLEERLDAKV